MKSRLGEIAQVFLKLGLIAFGGPAAHIAMMEDELVSKRMWMTREHFLDLLGVTHLIPGPNSTEMAIHCGYHRGGFPGLVLAGVCFIFPAFCLTLLGSILYAKYGQLPQWMPVFEGIRPIVIILIGLAVWKLGQKAVKTTPLGLTAGGVLIFSMFGHSEIILLFAGALLYCLLILGAPKGGMKSLDAAWIGFLPMASLTVWHTDWHVPLSKLFLVFLKIGAVLFGSGYVLIAYLNQELVETRHWISADVLMDAVAFGQMTPGPVLTTATFVGYQLNGLSGAVAATVGIFLPSFIFVLIVNPFVSRLRASKVFSVFLDGVNASVVGLMAAVCLKFTFLLSDSLAAIAILILGILVVWRFPKLSVLYLIAAGGAIGYLLSLFV